MKHYSPSDFISRMILQKGYNDLFVKLFFSYLSDWIFKYLHPSEYIPILQLLQVRQLSNFIYLKSKDDFTQLEILNIIEDLLHKFGVYDYFASFFYPSFHFLNSVPGALAFYDSILELDWFGNFDRDYPHIKFHIQDNGEWYSIFTSNHLTPKYFPSLINGIFPISFSDGDFMVNDVIYRSPDFSLHNTSLELGDPISLLSLLNLPCLPDKLSHRLRNSSLNHILWSRRTVDFFFLSEYKFLRNSHFKRLQSI